MRPTLKTGILAGILAGLVAACSDVPTSTGDDGPARSAPLISHAQAVPDRYIVVFNERAGDPEMESDRLMALHGGERLQTYRRAIRGFAADLSPRAVEALRRLPIVEYIETDQVMSIVETQTNPTWGLDRIDETDLPLDNAYMYDATGDNVHVYIIDTGIRTQHQEFGGRAEAVFDAFGGSGQDCNGHGTHVAGTVGGTTYGVAKHANLYAVRVLNCNGSGSTSGVIAGVDWVTENHEGPECLHLGGRDLRDRSRQQQRQCVQLVTGQSPGCIDDGRIHIKRQPRVVLQLWGMPRSVCPRSGHYLGVGIE
jgi:subtilisin family serine protease